MMPIAPLMIEHRLIEKMIALTGREIEHIEIVKKADVIFIDSAVDFIRTYADRTHHGKEEDILFEALSKKPMSEDHRKIMDELIEEHKFGRKTTGELVAALGRYINGQEHELQRILEILKQLVAFYPEHIRKEDQDFFMPCMAYFSKQEKDDMLEECWEFDRKMIHEKYRDVVDKWKLVKG